MLYTYAIPFTIVALHYLSIPITDAATIPLSDNRRDRCVVGEPTGKVAK